MTPRPESFNNSSDNNQKTDNMDVSSNGNDDIDVSKTTMTTTANGKAALACLDRADAARLVLTELETDRGEDRLMSVLAELENIRNGALATDEDEHTEGISAIGFAVRDPGGDVVAVSVPVPTSRYGRVKEKLTHVLNESKKLLR